MSGLAILFVPFYGALAVLAWKRPLLRKLAVKEAVRRRGQSILVIAGLMLGSTAITASLVGADSVSDSSVLNAQRQWHLIDLTVTSPDGFFPRGIAGTIADDPAVRAVADGVAGGFELTGSAADLDRLQGESGVTVSGFDPSAQAAFGSFTLQDGTRTTGESLADGEVLVNVLLAEAIDARVGDRLRVSVDAGNGRDAEPSDVRVAGITRMTGPGAYSLRAVVFVPLFTAERSLGLDGINVVRVSADGGVDDGVAGGRRAAPVLRDAVDDLGVPLSVREAKAAEIAAAKRSTEFLRSLMVGLSALIVAAGAALVVNLVSMLAEERRPRLAVLRALGLTRRGLIAFSVLEGALYSLVAALTGTTLGSVAGRVVASRFAAAFAQFSGGKLDFEYVFVRRASTLVASFAAGAVVTLIPVFFAARRTAKMSITSAIRNLPEPAAEPRRHSWLRVVVRIGGGLLGAAGVASGNDIGRLLGGLALIGLASALLRSKLAPRLRASLTGLFLGAWCVLNIMLQDPNADPDAYFGVFVFSMITAVFGFSVLAAANLRVVEMAIGPLGRIAGGLRALLRPPIAYLARRPVRTGLTTGVFALILAMLTLFAVFLFIFRPNYERDAAGYDVRVLSTGTASVELPATVAPNVRRSVLVPTRGYVGPFDSPNGFSGEHLFVPLFAFTDALFSDPPVYLAQRSEKYDDDAAVWAAVRTNPKLVVTDFGSPGSKVTLQGPSGPVEFEVAASMAFGILDGVIASEKALEPFRTAPLGASMLVDVQPGANARSVARTIESELFDIGVDAETTRKLLDDGYRANQTFFSVIDLLMRMGLVVGILSLGIVGARHVIERRHVIGVLRAIGYSRKSVLGGLMAEAASSALIGTLVGIFTGSLIGYVFYVQFDTQTGFGIQASSIASVILIVFAAVLLVTAWPAYRASRLPPAEAVRYSE